MELVLRELEQSIIISELDIEKIKKFLRRQESNDSNYEIALMSAQMVNKRINQALVGVDKKYWWQFKSAFIKFLADDDKKVIHKGDIFKLLLTVETEIEKSIEVAYKWLMLQAREMGNYKQIEDWIKVLKSGDRETLAVWKRMMMAATCVVVASSVSLSEAPKSGIKSENISRAATIQASHRQVESAIVEERAFIQAQTAIALKQDAIKLADSQKVVRVEQLAAISQVAIPLKEVVVKPIEVEKTVNLEKSKSMKKVNNPSKRVAVYPTRAVKKASGEKFKIPSMMAYKPYDVNKLQKVLVDKNSLLADEFYFDKIIKTAEAYGVDPRFVLAIAAQEQGLVKNSNKNAKKIANNPYNIYGSWVRYNTDISDSSAIVCRTILKRMDKWSGVGDPVVWLNKTYAADTNWSKGVKWNYENLKKLSQVE